MGCGDAMDPNPPSVPAFEVAAPPAALTALTDDYFVIDWPSGAAVPPAQVAYGPDLDEVTYERVSAHSKRDLAGTDPAFAPDLLEEIRQYLIDLDGDGKRDHLYVLSWRDLAAAMYTELTTRPGKLTLQESTTFGQYVLTATTDLNGDGAAELVLCKRIDAVDDRVFGHLKNGKFVVLARLYCTSC